MLASFLFVAPSAHAAEVGAEGATGAYGCSGNLIDTRNVTDGTRTYGKIYIYYSTANNGTNCAVTVDTYFGTSVRKFMTITIERCTTSACTRIDRSQEESDYFYQYAGPVSISGTNGYCISVHGTIERGSSPYEFGTGGVHAAHCG